MSAFIYVFDESAKEKLLALGYTLLKQDEDSDTYIFANDCSNMHYALLAESYLLSDSIAF